MVKKAVNRPLSFRTSALVVATACLIIGTVELQGLRAKEPGAAPAHKMDAVYCIKCHNTGKAIRIMRMKEDGANFLFNPDGTFKDPKLAAENPNHPRITDKSFTAQ